VDGFALIAYPVEYAIDGDHDLRRRCERLSWDGQAGSRTQIGRAWPNEVQDGAGSGAVPKIGTDGNDRSHADR
jgi:hypothetical protein